MTFASMNMASFSVPYCKSSKWIRQSSTQRPKPLRTLAFDKHSSFKKTARLLFWYHKTYREDVTDLSYILFCFLCSGCVMKPYLI